MQAKVASKSSASSKTPTHVPATKFTAQTPKTLSKSPAVPGSVKASSTDGDDGPEQDIVLLDGTVRKMDGRSDRLRANLERDLDAINEKLNAPNVSLAFYDEKHFIGTSEQFKKKVATVKESLKKIRGQVVLICPRIERTKTPSHYENERKRCDDMKDRIDAAVSLLSLVSSSCSFADVQGAISKAEDKHNTLSATFDAFAYWRMFDHYLAIEKYDEAMVALQSDTEILTSIATKISAAPADVQAHLQPKYLAMCSLEKSVESFLFTMPTLKQNEVPAKTANGKALKEVVKRIVVANEKCLVRQHAETAGKIHHMLSAEDVAYTLLEEALKSVIPDFPANVDAAPFLDETKDTLLKLMGCSAGRLIIEHARKVYLSRSDEAQWEARAKAAMCDTEGLIHSATETPALIDSLVPKLKQIENDISSFDLDKIKAKTLRKLIQEDLRQKFFDEAYPAVLRAPVSLLLPVFQRLPLGAEFDMPEKRLKFYDDMRHLMEQMEEFKPVKLKEYLLSKADGGGAGSRRKLFDQAMAVHEKCVSFFHWVSVYDFGDDATDGGNPVSFMGWSQLATNGANVYIVDLHGDKELWAIFEGSALRFFSAWHQKQMKERSAAVFTVFASCLAELTEEGTEDKGKGTPTGRLRWSIEAASLHDADAAPFYAFIGLVEACTKMSLQAHVAQKHTNKSGVMLLSLCV